jgi:signal transduction histidine kinase
VLSLIARSGVWHSPVFYAGCALAAISAAWILYRLRLSQETGRLNAAMEVRLAERERIARELHDTLLQSVQGLILRFQSVADRLPAAEVERTRLAEALRQANAVAIETRQRVQGLRERSEGGDLESLLTEQVELLDLPGSITVDILVTGRRRMLRPDVVGEIGAIMGEALLNVSRHASAVRVEINLTFTRKGFVLTIVDDGRGIVEEDLARHGHFGIVGMRERAERLTGSFSIGRHERGGTEVRVMVPRISAYDDLLSWRGVRVDA